MAWSQTKTFQHNEGNQVVQAWKLTADSASLALDTALGVVNHAVISPASVSTANFKYGINVLSGGTSSNGYVSITEAASGDVIYVTVYGR